MKSYDLPVARNPLKSRDDVASSLIAMLAPCRENFVLGGAGLRVGNTSAVYCDRTALMEGWARLLWGVAPLRHGGFSWEGTEVMVRGLSRGTDPASPDYWGDVTDFDQKIVEMAPIALALLLDPSDFWDGYSPEEKKRVYAWLESVNHRTFADNNWKFFRVLVNLAFEKRGLPADTAIMEKDLSLIDSYYVADGWYRDKYPFDNYNPFAIQFYSLIYSVFRKDKDPERCARYEKRVREFARQYVHYLTDDGLIVPYGRSLTYRFAVISFYSACAFAGIEVLPWGVMKGIVLRHLRWWLRQPIFDRDGMLTIGWRYPSLEMSEQYNAPGSPYWAFKAYLVLALPGNHPFWKAEELPLQALKPVKALPVPGFLATRPGNDAVLLCAGQYPEFQMNHTAEKYAKFAYSARFGFSCAVSSYDFPKTGCDSMLYVSTGDGYWFPRRKIEEKAVTEEWVKSIWSPLEGIRITTWLVPAGAGHVRVHRIESTRSILTKEGGFALGRYQGFDPVSPVDVKTEEGTVSASLPWGYTTIRSLLPGRSAVLVQPSPNLNLMNPVVVVPVLEGTAKEGTTWHAAFVAASEDRDFAKESLPVSFQPEEGKLTIGGKDVKLA